MSISPRDVVTEYLRRAGTGEPVSKIAELVSEEVDWFVAGDTDTVPWIGRKIGKAGAAEFYQCPRISNNTAVKIRCINAIVYFEIMANSVGKCQYHFSSRPG